MNTMRLNSRLGLIIILLILFAITPLMNAQALTVALTFEGLADQEPILNYYDGGYGGLGSGPGPDLDITFGVDALALIDSDDGGSGNFANEPSADTVAFFLSGPGVIMNVHNGFTTGFSFYYSGSQLGSVTVYDGLNGTGNLLATLELPPNYQSCGLPGDPNGSYACWDPIGVSFSGTAYSVNFSGAANFIGFDEITMGSVLPGNLPPEADANGPYLGPVEPDVIYFDGTGSSDPEGDPLTYDWDFGDGYTGSGVDPNHSYVNTGIFDVCLTVTDPGGLSDTACTTAVVYDPSAGFVTGGGWFESPAGAYRPDEELIGNATFGFVSKYHKGAKVPVGNTEFQFHAAELNFHSSTYQWLVVTGANYAKFKGEGAINGMGDYKFMIWAGDNEPDTFRIKIWTEDELGNETVIYDNGFDQEIASGSIIIHTKK